MGFRDFHSAVDSELCETDEGRPRLPLEVEARSLFRHSLDSRPLLEGVSTLLCLFPGTAPRAPNGRQSRHTEPGGTEQTHESRGRVHTWACVCVLSTPGQRPESSPWPPPSVPPVEKDLRDGGRAGESWKVRGAEGEGEGEGRGREKGGHGSKKENWERQQTRDNEKRKMV